MSGFFLERQCMKRNNRKNYEKKNRGKTSEIFFGGRIFFREDNVEIFSGRTMSEIFSGRTMSEIVSGRTTSKICSGRTTSKIYSGRTMSINCLGRTMSENGQGGQRPKMLMEDNVRREIVSILFRESNTNNRSGNSITREVNG